MKTEMEMRAVRIGVFQFSASENICSNIMAISAAIARAAEQQVRLLVFRECALCGYPPVEIESVASIDQVAVDDYYGRVSDLAKEHAMYVALGNIRNEGDARYNSIQLLGPEGTLVGNYDKRALWGWDIDNYRQGSQPGIFTIDGIKVGFRICFEMRFPEYFRELFAQDVQLCFVSFNDVSDEEDASRFDIIKAHLVTRAVENVMTVVSVNSTSKRQTAPTAIFSTGGHVLQAAPHNQEHLLVYDFEAPKLQYGAQGRIHYSRELLGLS